METIIGLLFILLPVIFKLIGRRLEQSGKSESAERMRKIAESFSDDDASFTDWLNEDDAPEEDVTVTAPEVTVPEPVMPAPVIPEVRVEVPQNVQRRRTPILKEDVADKKHEKIDPKKLVIYSEIMNPKYKD